MLRSVLIELSFHRLMFVFLIIRSFVSCGFGLVIDCCFSALSEKCFAVSGPTRTHEPENALFILGGASN